MENSKIEWTDHTFNPWIGCQKVSPGCDHCYAEMLMDKRYGKVEWGPRGERVRTSQANWRNPFRWNSSALSFLEERGRRPRVFCASLADIFDNRADRAWRQDLFEVIRECPNLDWLLLTKRPENIRKMLPSDWGDGYPNVWVGVTAEDQHWFDRRWRLLSEIPAVVRFISYEPALGPVRLPTSGPLPDWVISGGESGPGARPIKRKWVRNIIRDCNRADVAVFLKQWGTYASNPLVAKHGLTIDEAKTRDPYGKGGGLIDGQLIREFPIPRRRIVSNAA